MNRAILLGAFAMLVGCGDDKHPANVAPDSDGGARATGGKSNRAGSAGMAGRAGSSGANTRGGSGGGGGETATELGGSAGTAGAAGEAGYAVTAGYAGTAGVAASRAAPVVTITAPLVAEDPSSTNVLLGDVVDVTCLATAASVPGATVDPSTVEIVLVDGAHTIAPTSTPTRDPVKGTTATFSIAAQPSGPITFACTAHDGTLADLRGTTTLTTLVDRGPLLKFSSPTNKDIFALSTLVTVNFDVETTRLSATDTGANIDPASVTLTIDGMPIGISAAATTADKITFQTAPVNMKASPFSTGNYPSGYTVISATAKNQRKAQGRAEVTINVDDQPPIITVVSPTSGSIVAGEIWLVFTVVDPVSGTDPGSGVAENTVVVVMNQRRVQYDATDQIHWKRTGSQYSFMFTEADLAGSKAQASIQISATDVAGNLNSGQTSLLLYLDNQPPMVDLDPPTIREFFTEQGARVCTDAFDPLGEAVNDREIATGPTTFRVLAWDKTNDPGGTGAQYVSDVADGTVSLWIQDDTRVPLLADADGDGICDSISKGTDTSPARFASLTKIAPIGDSPKFHNSGQLVDDTRFWSAPSMGNCSATTLDQTSPVFLCESNSDMVRVIRHNSAKLTPVVYGLDPSTTLVECTGRYWDIGIFDDTSPSVTEGWVCLAATATDTRGNVGISRVLRVCWDDPTLGRPLCASDAYQLSPATQANALAWVPTQAKTRSNQYPALPDCSCEAGQNLCTYQQDSSTQIDYCSAKKAHCYTDVDVSKVTLQCATTEKLCVPRDPNGTSHCIPIAQSCDPDVDIATAVATPCATGQKLCIPWNAERTAYCVGLTESCIADIRKDVAQCPSCLPTRYDIINAKCTGELCPLGSIDPGCQPKNTIRCPCNPLCNAGSTTEPAGCTPYRPATKVDPCAVNCRPPTNAGSIRFVRSL